MMELVKKCNLCGKEFNTWDAMLEFGLHKRVGYGTEYDGEVVDLDICCDCFDKLVKLCEISPVEKTL